MSGEKAVAINRAWEQWPNLDPEVVAEMVAAGWEAHAAQVVPQPNREALAKVLMGLDAKGDWGQSAEWERVVFYEQADAVIAHLSAQPVAGEVEWEYGWNTGSTFMVIGSREDAEQWLDQFDAKLGVGDWGSRMRRRRRAPEPDPWTEVQP